ncbi:hypothetical protein A2229_00370 [Candidatus Peregrinibacteria bacterium RIFOXYA2_FULL_33_7]|nr:MAG: oxidoreductase FAD/NAD(P)-binding domain-containing protein [Candidatus Peregrinibacteria bacterium GW2011_GWC2_33_13]OGJ47165.1 MAG: hypothetical protein A2229_00370 [Candidatus Peregrinibacteria bacterium RIFOXYA2_FULL_33_7]
MTLSSLFYEIGVWSGLIGFFSLGLLIFSGDTARYFNKNFGLDKIIKFQKKFSLIVTFFITLHPLFFIISSKNITAFLIPDFQVLPLALGITAFYILIIIMLASTFYKRISYLVWQYLHVLTYILFFFAFYHAVNWGSDSENIIFKIIYSILFIAIIIGLIYRTQYKIKKRHSGKFFVKEIQQETKDTFSLFLTQEKTFKFQAGQFCFLRLNKDKLYARHPFTIASSPTEKNLRFTIKLAGRFTRFAQNLKKGEEVLLDGPFGIFTKKDNRKDLIFIAGGVGITPFLSLIKDNLDHNQKITLLYGSKTKDNIIFKDELDKIQKPWFQKIYVLSQENENVSNVEKGYITKKLIQKYVKNPTNSLFYICGPESMKNSVKKALKEMKVPKKNIFIEDFFW